MVAACSLREDEHMEHNTRATKSRQLSKHTPFVGIATVVVMWGYWISFDLDDDWMFYFVMGSTAAAALFLLARGLPGLAAVGLLSAVAAAPLVAIMLPPVTLMALITGPFVFGAALGELMTYPARVWLPVVAVAAIGFVAGDLVGVGDSGPPPPMYSPGSCVRIHDNGGRTPWAIPNPTCGSAWPDDGVVLAVVTDESQCPADTSFTRINLPPSDDGADLACIRDDR